MKFKQNDRCGLEVTDAQYDDGSLQLSLQLDGVSPPTLDELLRTGYVKLSVYERGEFTERGTLTLYQPTYC